MGETTRRVKNDTALSKTRGRGTDKKREEQGHSGKARQAKPRPPPTLNSITLQRQCHVAELAALDGISKAVAG